MSKILVVKFLLSTESNVATILEAATSSLAGECSVKELDLSNRHLPVLNEVTLGALTQPGSSLASIADELIDQVMQADAVIVACPMFNLGVPAAVKAWMDLVAVPKRTFSYTDDGLVGLCKLKYGLVIMASGGTKIGGPEDFASGHLESYLKMLGAKETAVVGCDSLNRTEVDDAALVAEASKKAASATASWKF